MGVEIGLRVGQGMIEGAFFGGSEGDLDDTMECSASLPTKDDCRHSQLLFPLSISFYIIFSVGRLLLSLFAKEELRRWYRGKRARRRVLLDGRKMSIAGRECCRACER